jgi:hypothetical protein
VIATRDATADLTRLREVLGRAAPDHLLSFAVPGSPAVRYTRGFTLDDLFPWQRQARRAALRHGRDARITAHTAAHTFAVQTRSGHALFLPDRAEDLAVGSLVFGVASGWVTLHNGMVLGSYDAVGRLRMVTCAEVRVDSATGCVSVADQPGGRLRNDAGGLVLEMDDAHPEVLLLAILLVFAATR